MSRRRIVATSRIGGVHSLTVSCPAAALAYAMHTNTREICLDAPQRAATTERVRLALIEACLCEALRAQSMWRGTEGGNSHHALLRTRAGIRELIRLGEADASPRTCRLTGLCAYLLSALIEAEQTRDERQLAAVIRVLEEERDHWQSVCQRHADRSMPRSALAAACGQEPASALPSQRNALTIDA